MPRPHPDGKCKYTVGNQQEVGRVSVNRTLDLFFKVSHGLPAETLQPVSTCTSGAHTGSTRCGGVLQPQAALQGGQMASGLGKVWRYREANQAPPTGCVATLRNRGSISRPLLVVLHHETEQVGDWKPPAVKQYVLICSPTLWGGRCLSRSERGSISGGNAGEEKERGFFYEAKKEQCDRCFLMSHTISRRFREQLYKLFNRRWAPAFLFFLPPFHPFQAEFVYFSMETAARLPYCESAEWEVLLPRWHGA